MPSILCPHDFTPCSERALEVACELASLLNQPIELMHVYQLAFLPEPAIGASGEWGRQVRRPAGPAQRWSRLTTAAPCCSSPRVVGGSC